MGKLYVIYCMTGCTCCNDENHYRGFYKTRDDAEKRKEYFLDPNANHNPLASQYLRKGGYEIIEVDAEFIDKDRIIVNDTVHSIDSIFDVNEDGSILGNDEIFNLGGLL